MTADPIAALTRINCAKRTGTAYNGEGQAGDAVMSSRRHPIALIGSVMLVVLLVGCSLNTAEPARTKEATALLSLREAKAVALSIDHATLASIPPRFMTASTVQEEGGLYPCSTEGWSGYNTVFIELTSDFDLGRTFDEIEQYAKTNPSFMVKRSKGITGTPRLTAKGPGHSSYFVSFDEAKASGDIDTFSPCPELPEGADHRDLF